MEKQIDPIGEKLKAKRKERKVSVPELSAALDIPQDRIYKWEKGASPKYEDRLKIEAWMNDPKYIPKKLGTSSEEKFLSGEIKLTAQEYVDELKRDKERLERLLEDTQRVISTNLTALMQLMSAVHRHDLAFHETQLQALARLENKKDPPDLVEKANIRETELMVEEMKAGKMSYVEGR